MSGFVFAALTPEKRAGLLGMFAALTPEKRAGILGMFAALTEEYRIGLLVIWSMLVIILFLYSILRSHQLGRRTGFLLLNLVQMLIVFLIFEYLNWCALGLIPENMPFYLGFSWQRTMMPRLIFAHSRILAAAPWILLILTVSAGIGMRQIGDWRRMHISSASVKEAFDLMPVGCCYSVSSGLPRLVNRTMDQIALSLTGNKIADAERFWELLHTGQMPGMINGGEDPILRLKDGRVYSFRREELQTEDGLYYELIAVDATEEYRLTQELERKQREARIQNSRLKALIGTIEYITMSRELLQIKTALHDNLGQSLLYARRYLLEPDSVDKNEMLNVWNNNLRHLQHEGPEDWQLPYYVIGKQAEQLGIDLTIDGRLPGEEHLLDVTDAAISAHIMNVLRHAEGSRAHIKITESPEEYFLKFTNDGRPPEGEIREKGGLSNLRREVEAVGGTMTVKSSPQFELDLTLPKQKRI